MGRLIVEHQANIGTITEIDIQGVTKITCNITNGKQSDPIDLPSGHYTAKITRIVANEPVIEEISFDIKDGKDTVYLFEIPKA